MSSFPVRGLIFLACSVYLLITGLYCYYIFFTVPDIQHAISGTSKEFFESSRHERMHTSTRLLARTFPGHAADKQYWEQWMQFTSQRLNKTVSHPSKRVTVNSNSKHNTSAISSQTTVPQQAHVVEIWSYDPLGRYLWQHILDGALTPKGGGVWSYGEKTIQSMKFKFRTGRGVTPAKVPADAEHVVLVLNARSSVQVKARVSLWLRLLAQLSSLRSAGLLVLGSEVCDNSWLDQLLMNFPPLKFAFVIYASPNIDGKRVFPWPLGVSVYRGFPLPAFTDLIIPGERRYICNYMGTVYPNSSRVALLNMSATEPLCQKCFFKFRSEWLSKEKKTSLQSYVDVLKQSDLTLCPIGFNSETYRIYEALSMGSIPVVEDVVASATCGTPFQLLREPNSPVMFVKNWKEELPGVLRRFDALPLSEKVAKRLHAVQWYAALRKKLRTQFVSQVEQKFNFDDVD